MRAIPEALAAALPGLVKIKKIPLDRPPLIKISIIVLN
jgi:hypothetical protein